jgi:hypothetical protein
LRILEGHHRSRRGESCHTRPRVRHAARHGEPPYARPARSRLHRACPDRAASWRSRALLSSGRAAVHRRRRMGAAARCHASWCGAAAVPPDLQRGVGRRSCGWLRRIGCRDRTPPTRARPAGLARALRASRRHPSAGGRGGAPITGARPYGRSRGWTCRVIRARDPSFSRRRAERRRYVGIRSAGASAATTARVGTAASHWRREPASPSPGETSRMEKSAVCGNRSARIAWSGGGLEASCA